MRQKQNVNIWVSDEYHSYPVISSSVNYGVAKTFSSFEQGV